MREWEIRASKMRRALREIGDIDSAISVDKTKIENSDTPEQYRSILTARIAEEEGQLAKLKNDMVRLEEDIFGEPSLAAALAHQFERYPGREEVLADIGKALRCEYRLPTPEDGAMLALARKNPSAARLLRVWQTTEGFLAARAAAIPELVDTRKRAVLTLREEVTGGIYSADVPGLGQVELFVEAGGNGRRCEARTIAYLIGEQIERLRPGSRLVLVPSEGRNRRRVNCTVDTAVTEAYRPYQVISSSPNLLLAMVPATAALRVAREMQRGYAAEFGKVQGRLPFHVGLIFMDAHYPVFAALDTARRLCETFDQVGSQCCEAELMGRSAEDGVQTLQLRNERFGQWRWRVPERLGDTRSCATIAEAQEGSDQLLEDYYHPYWLVRNGEGLDERRMSLMGPGAGGGCTCQSL